MNWKLIFLNNIRHIFWFSIHLQKKRIVWNLLKCINKTGMLLACRIKLGWQRQSCWVGYRNASTDSNKTEIIKVIFLLDEVRCLSPQNLLRQFSVRPGRWIYLPPPPVKCGIFSRNVNISTRNSESFNVSMKTRHLFILTSSRHSGCTENSTSTSTFLCDKIYYHFYITHLN